MSCFVPQHEDKKWTIQWNPEGMMLVFKDLAKEPFFPGSLRGNLQFLLSK
jgi:hypothetical protein